MREGWARPRLPETARAIGLITFGLILATTSSIGRQDLTTQIVEAKAAHRWQSSSDAAPQGSIRNAALRVHEPQNVIAGAEVPGTDEDSEMAVASMLPGAGALVNASPKSDLKITKTRAASRRDLPASGQIWKLDNILAPQGEMALPRGNFTASPRRMREIMTAYSAFVRQGNASPTVDVAQARPIPRAAHAVAALEARAAAMQAVREQAAATAPVSPSLVAYAAPEQQIQAPFEAVIGAPSIALPDGDAGGMTITPRAKPQWANLFGWLRGSKPANGDHVWADDPLPAIVFTAPEQKCLAEGIYFEARGESVEGQAAVAQVILNRVKAPAYPDTICGVVYQNKSMRNRCQFSFACDGIRDSIRSARSWAIAQRVASEVTSGTTWSEKIGSSTHYHATYVKPRWAGTMKRMERVGKHIFYKTYRGGWS